MVPFAFVIATGAVIVLFLMTVPSSETLNAPVGGTGILPAIATPNVVNTIWTWSPPVTVVIVSVKLVGTFDSVMVVVDAAKFPSPQEPSSTAAGFRFRNGSPPPGT